MKQNVIHFLHLNYVRNRSVCLSVMSIVVSAQFPTLKRYLVELATNKCMNIEEILIPGNEVMKRCLNGGKGQIMRSLIPKECTYNILIISKKRNQLRLVRGAKSDVIKSGSSSLDKESISDLFHCIPVFVPNISADFNL